MGLITGELTMTTVTRSAVAEIAEHSQPPAIGGEAPVRWFEQIACWFKQIRILRKERYRPPYCWYDIDNCGL